MSKYKAGDLVPNGYGGFSVIIEGRDVPESYWAKYQSAFMVAVDGQNHDEPSGRVPTGGGFNRKNALQYKSVLVAIPSEFHQTHNEWGEISP